MLKDAQPCLEPEEFKEYLLGRLGPIQAAVVQEHLSYCDPCAQRCGDLDFQEVPFIATLQRAQKTIHVDLTHACSELIELSQSQQPLIVRPFLSVDPSDTQVPTFESTNPATSLVATIPPPQLGRYKIGKLLGRGGMGSVYEAFDERLHRKVAIKFPHQTIQANPLVRQRFQIEARAAAAIHHPHVCSVLDSDELNGLCYLTMPLLNGQSLSSRLRQQPRLPLKQVIAIVIGICEGLEAVHVSGIVHRDIKPANVFLQTNGTVTLMDFGLALAENSDDRLTSPGALIGTPTYFAPEQARGDAKAIGAWTDLYAVGTILYELLSGHPPYTGLSGEVIGHILHTPVPDLRSHYAECDVVLVSCCMKAISKEPALRYQTANEFAQTLRSWTDSHLNKLPTSPRVKQPNKMRWLIGLAFAACLGFSFVIFKMQTPWGELKLELTPPAPLKRRRDPPRTF